MNEVVREFLLETQENLAQLDLDLVTLEKDPTDHETTARVFRTLHTIKGTAGFLGLLKLQTVAHAAENLLSPIMDGELAPTSDVISGLLSTVDAIRRMLVVIEKTEKEGDTNYTLLLEELASLHAGNGAAAPPAVVDLRNAVTPNEIPKIEPAPEPAPPPPPPPPPVVQKPAAVPPRPAPNGPPPKRMDRPPIVALDTADGKTLAPVEPEPAARLDAPATMPVPQRVTAYNESAIRVDVRLLDDLMGMIGELVLTRNQIMEFSDALDSGDFVSSLQRLNVLTTHLQTGVMKTRMQPIGNIWSKFPRIVRDMAAALGKQARLDVEGNDTELDKTILEAIRDPLTHIIRNSVDHGIEMPEVRKQRGKAAEGRLLMQAYHEGGTVVVKISDDGGGIDPHRIKEKAVAARLISAERAELMSERSLLNLIFTPGFSTAESVSQFSGRGVGMNVVRTNIEKIGGTVDIESRLGRGTTLNIKIPLTLAIIPALTVTCAGECFAIPQIGLVELIRLEGNHLRTKLEQIRGTLVYRLRSKLLPLVFLSEQLQLGAAPTPAHLLHDGLNGQPAPEALNIVVLQADDRQFGLIVDEIQETGDIVVKPLQRHLKDVNVFAGATMLGDGRIALIIDILGLARRAHIISTVRARMVGESQAFDIVPVGEQLTMIVCAGPDNRRLAMPLGQVTRLEEFPRSALEWMGNQVVIQYRGRILPLVDVFEVLGVAGHDRPSLAQQMAASIPGDPNDAIQVVVHTVEERVIGLYIGEILDIVEDTLASPTPGVQPLVLFSCVIHGRVTEFLDVDAIIQTTSAARTPGGEAAAVEA